MAERDLTLLRKAYSADTPAVVRAYTPGDSKPLATGKLTFVDSTVDTTSGTIAAKAEFANEHFELWPGMYVDVEIDLAVRPDIVMIPAVAIQSGQQGPFVFVATPDNKASMRKVELLGVEGNLAALTSGVKDGENVIVEGQMRLTDGARINIVPPDAKPEAKPDAKTAPAGDDAKAEANSGTKSGTKAGAGQ